jgi:hypothetical protein
MMSASSTSHSLRTGFWRRLAPSGPEWVALLLGIAMPLAYGRVWLSLDGDPGRHVRVGETILRSGLFYSDPFSFTKAGAPFIPYEWLSEVLFALSVRLAGLPGMLILTGVVLGLTYAVVTRTMLRRRISPILTALVLLFLLALGLTHWHARPHIYTLLGAAILMTLIDRAADRRAPLSGGELWASVWPIIPLFALWANLHGGFLYGLFLLAAVIVGDRLEMLAATTPADIERWRGTLIRHATMLGFAVAAALLNPSGVKLYAHTLGYLGDTYMVDHTEEYTSPNFHILHFAAIAIVLVVWVLATLRRRPRYPTVTIVALNLGFALLAVRNLPLFGIIVLPLVAAEGQRSLEGHVPEWAAHWVAGHRRHSIRLGLAWPALAMAAMFWLARTKTVSAPDTGDFETFAHTLLPTTFNPSIFPVRAVRDARAAQLPGRMLSEFAWGGYILYAWPEQRVFIDGQTDFYGDSIMREHGEILELQPGWRAKLAAWKIQLALLGTRTALADALAHEDGWRPLYCDTTAVMFAHDTTVGAALGPTSSLASSCASLRTTPMRVWAARTPDPADVTDRFSQGAKIP